MSHEDDNGNAVSSRGDRGGLYKPKPIRVSAHLSYLQKLVERGETTAQDVAAAMDFCRNLIASPDSSERDRNNAAKTIATIAKMTADVALALHKDDRLDSGHATENVKVFSVTIPGQNDE